MASSLFSKFSTLALTSVVLLGATAHASAEEVGPIAASQADLEPIQVEAPEPENLISASANADNGFTQAQGMVIAPDGTVHFVVNAATAAQQTTFTTTPLPLSCY